MTKINEYLWHLPHQETEDDPPDVVMLQQVFNAPIVAALEGPLGEMGYEVKSNDVVVKLDSQIDTEALEDARELKDTFTANVRFIAYMEVDVLVRVHFEHREWAHFLPTHDQHSYFVNLDRFKVRDPKTQVAIPGWGGRLHSRMSCDPESGLHHNGEDQIWVYRSAEDLEGQLQLFLRKFHEEGHRWLTNRATM